MTATQPNVSAVRSDLPEIARTIHRHVLGLAPPVAPGEIDRLRAVVLERAPLCSPGETAALIEMVSRQLFGLGPLEELLADASVSEIMVNGPGAAWVERHGRVEPTSVVLDATALRAVIERIVAPLGLRVDRAAPFVDARLADGSRVHIAVPPLALDGPYLTIRRFGDRPFPVEAFCAVPVADLLCRAVRAGRSIVVSGGTGSGKTTLLNALAGHIPERERIVTIEDAAELRLPGDHVVRLEARPANAEGIGAVSVRTLVRNALRMRPDRIVVGEVRGAEALDMVQAMHTGHEGSMSTCHANSPVDALGRLESMMLMSDVALPLSAVRIQVRSAVDLVVQVARGLNGGRRVVAVIHCEGPTHDWLVRDQQITPKGERFEALLATHPAQDAPDE